MNTFTTVAEKRELMKKAQQLDDVVYELRNHTTMCPPECTPAKHIAAVYADGEECTNLMRKYLYLLRRVREATTKQRSAKDTVKAIKKLVENFDT